MNEQITSNSEDPQGDYYAPWEKAFDRILTPFEEFIHRQTTGGLVLMCTAILALLLANSPFAEIYHSILKTRVGVSFGGWNLNMTLHHWINDGLMALFFFVIGLELKREFLVGELASLRNATLPILAAIGGMVVPALVYLALNPQGDAVIGWGVPMATDIAFAVGVMALLGNRVPKALIAFLLALAIVDDLGAVMVIALFYTETIALAPLAATGGLFVLLMTFNLAGIRNPIPYFIVAILMWYALYLSGVHATLAGVLGALSVPAKPKYDPEKFSMHVRKLMNLFDANHKTNRNIMTNIKLRGIVQTLENGVHSVETPLQRLEHVWHMPVVYVVIPIFALANAGIPLSLDSLSESFTHPVMLGVMLGLTIGKFLGITGMSWLALRLGVAELPEDTRFGQIAGVSFLAGIGFTMSIFIAELGFVAREDLLLIAKTGILIASLLAGIVGYVWLYLVGRPAKMTNE